MSLALWRRLDGKIACIFENGTVAEKRGPLSPEKAFNFKPTAASESGISKKCQTMYFHANTIKKGQKIPNDDVHAKHHFFMTNHFKKGQISGIWPQKMPTWQPCYWGKHKRKMAIRALTNTAVLNLFGLVSHWGQSPSLNFPPDFVETMFYGTLFSQYPWQLLAWCYIL